jgi:hypothetical protein
VAAAKKAAAKSAAKPQPVITTMDSIIKDDPAPEPEDTVSVTMPGGTRVRVPARMAPGLTR